MDQKIIVYHPNGDIRLEVKTGGETMWLTQEQMCWLFGRERSAITKHIGNSLKESEIDRERNVNFCTYCGWVNIAV